MPKRRRELDLNLDYVRKKIKKLEKQLSVSRNRRRIIEPSSSTSSSSRESSPSPSNSQDGINRTKETILESQPDVLINQPIEDVDAGFGAEDPGPSGSVPPEISTSPSGDTPDSILLDILGEDPSPTEDYGPDIHKDLAKRFVHIATTGLDLKTRKDLSAKYQIPANCSLIAAPILNAEIKAALPEAMLKRDKGLEARQKQLSTAIACLASAMTDQLNSKQINQDLLKKLMDTARLLCDIQQTDAKTRRNFAMHSVKKDMKEHLSSTRVDKFLFGENLTETLKTAKAVNKSSTELKIPTKISQAKKPMAPVTKPQGRNLNWKPPAPARRPLGPQRSREPVYHRTQLATSSKQSSPPQRITRRR